ncbi:hypothetical protein [uncultured Cohaesibacter sp.]|uniref:hypothetical protein n=1 Tax=uncultured Cohaesibacter sp. TaxID=1002546 RepID=UPI0029C8D2DA|nr:hypothetical protein [uncultured Cohaesibacter sp.]
MTGWTTLKTATISSLMIAGASIVVSGPSVAAPMLSAPTIHRAVNLPFAHSNEQAKRTL